MSNWRTSCPWSGSTLLSRANITGKRSRARHGGGTDEGPMKDQGAQAPCRYYVERVAPFLLFRGHRSVHLADVLLRGVRRSVHFSRNDVLTPRGVEPVAGRPDLGELGHLDLEFATDATNAPKVIVSGRGGEPRVDRKPRRPRKERQAGSGERARRHRYRRRLDHERAAAGVPRGDVNTLVAGKS